MRDNAAPKMSGCCFFPRQGDEATEFTEVTASAASAAKFNKRIAAADGAGVPLVALKASPSFLQPKGQRQAHSDLKLLGG